MKKSKFFLTVVGLLLTVVAQAYEYIDLGLTSRTLWATTNVGASSATDNGSYFAWGETATKDTYSQSNYAHASGITAEGEWSASKLTKYCATDGKTVLESADDAATKVCGSTWTMPTTAQLQELIDECTWTVEGNGYRVTGKNGNSIYLPFAGYKYDGPSGTGTHEDTTRGLYWASSCSSTYSEANYLDIRTDGTKRVSTTNRFYGYTVRPVSTEKASNVVTTITIDPEKTLDQVKAELGDGVNNITEIYITGNYPNKASIDAIKTKYFPNLEKVHLTLETSAKEISTSAYQNCTLLASINIPSSVTSIDSHAFHGCSGLTSITIPNSVTRSIGTSAFEGCRGLTSITIPNSVTGIGTSAFSGCSGLSSITIPNSVTSIGTSAFYKCSGLTNITIPNSVTSIGSSAFYGCSGLTSITIPNSVTSIGSYAFQGCSGLTSVIIENGVKSIDNNAFQECSGLSSITIPNSVTSIGTSAFYKCSGLTSITIPNSVTSIGSSTFSGCSGLTSITIPNSVTSIGAYAFYRCSGLSSVTIENGVKSIDKNAFQECSGLSSITIPNSVTSIGSDAFQGCSLYTINSLNSTPPTIPSSSAILNRYTLVFVPQADLDKYHNASIWNEFSNRILALGCRTNYDVTVSAKDDCSNLDEVIGRDNLPSVVRLKVSGTINSYDLMTINNKMINLTELDLSDATIVANSYMYRTGYSSIDNVLTGYAISGNLSKLILPKNIVEISDYAFASLKSLKELRIPASVMKISNIDGVFERFIIEQSSSTINIVGQLPAGIEYLYLGRPFTGSQPTNNCCKTLKDIVIGEGVKSIPRYIFQDVFMRFNSLTIPSTLQTIESNNNLRADNIYLNNITTWCNLKGMDNDNAETRNFYLNNELIENLIIPEGVANIPKGMFKGGTFKSVSIPSSLETLGAYVFSNCTHLSNCTIPINSHLTSIGSYAFEKSGLEEMRLPTSVQTIQAYAFYGCSSMTEIRLPSSLNSIADYAFGNCNSLKDIYTYTVEPQQIGQHTFGGTTFSYATLHCPKISFNKYYYNTQWSQFLKLVNFDEPYDYIFLDNDFEVTETTGIIGGTPDADLHPGSGMIVDDGMNQPLDEVHIAFDGKTTATTDFGSTFKGASLVGRVKANKIYLDLEVKADYWYSFCFPFDVDLKTIQKSGGYVFRKYDGQKRANGESGWTEIAAGTEHLNAGEGYIFRTNTAGTLTIVIDKKTIEANDLTIDKLTELNTYNASSTDNKSWNFVGNRYLCYYDINTLGYEAPVVVWNGSSYDALRPGDDEYVFYPFQAFFVQKPDNVAEVGFEAAEQTTFLKSGNLPSMAKAKARKAAKLNQNRRLINITLSDGNTTDKTRVVFNENQTMAYETGCDAAKFNADGVAQLYTLDNNGIKYSINERPVGNGRVQMGYTAPAKGTFTISATRMDAHAYVEDAKTGALFDLANGDYTFTSEAGTFANRFTLVLDSSEITAIRNLQTESASEGNTYDLSGRRTAGESKGVVIKNGKKVIVK